MSSFTIERLTPEQASAAIDELVILLQDTVESGASVGFLPPLSREDACAYWDKVIHQVSDETRVLLIARVEDEIAGSVQLEAARWVNGMHRAEVQKLMVHRRFRQQGIGRGLMQVVEEEARKIGRTLLVLDTRRGDVAEGLYVRLGYSRAGVIPKYALSASGQLDDTVILYRQL